MDFMNRGVRQSSDNQAPAGVPTPARTKSSKLKKPGKVLGTVYIVLLVSVTILVLATLFSIAFGGTKSENRLIDKGSLQAVFLNNGQVYFGNIKSMNDKYMKLDNIYYLQVNQQVQPGQQPSPNNISLAKLGCELHGPKDTMVINQDQVSFWENLKSDGKVATAVADFVKENPNGQDCSKQSQIQDNTANSGSTDNKTNNNEKPTTPNATENKKP